MTIRKSFALIFICLFAVVVTACRTADRGGVTITPKFQEPPADDSAITEPQPRFLLSGVTKCLEMHPTDYVGGKAHSIVRAWDCLAWSSFQGWFYTPKLEILSSNGQCLTVLDEVEEPAEEAVSENETENGASVVAATCDGSEAQQWIQDSQALVIQNKKIANSCLEIPFNEIFNNGGSLRAATCTGKQNQQWQMLSLVRKHLKNQLDPELHVNIEPIGQPPYLKASLIVKGWESAEWLLEPEGPYYRIRNYWQAGQFLNLEFGDLQSGPIIYYWQSALWDVVPQASATGDTYLIRNAWRGDHYIGLDENNTLKGDVLANLKQGSAVWQISRVHLSSDN